eukprot:GEMP01010231.1.p1 GENE.GEMP01010231.1~~GEMP01010231.1.p1  ORF type:complete len:684 (-),score=136.17 GEMP01010231.1:1297-3318(-)
MARAMKATKKSTKEGEKTSPMESSSSNSDAKQKAGLPTKIIELNSNSLPLSPLPRVETRGRKRKRPSDASTTEGIASDLSIPQAMANAMEQVMDDAAGQSQNSNNYQEPEPENTTLPEQVKPRGLLKRQRMKNGPENGKEKNVQENVKEESTTRAIKAKSPPKRQNTKDSLVLVTGQTTTLVIENKPDLNSPNDVHSLAQALHADGVARMTNRMRNMEETISRQNRAIRLKERENTDLQASLTHCQQQRNDEAKEASIMEKTYERELAARDKKMEQITSSKRALEKVISQQRAEIMVLTEKLKESEEMAAHHQRVAEDSLTRIQDLSHVHNTAECQRCKELLPEVDELKRKCRRLASNLTDAKLRALPKGAPKELVDSRKPVDLKKTVDSKRIPEVVQRPVRRVAQLARQASRTRLVVPAVSPNVDTVDRKFIEEFVRYPNLQCAKEHFQRHIDDLKQTVPSLVSFSKNIEYLIEQDLSVDNMKNVASVWLQLVDKNVDNWPTPWGEVGNCEEYKYAHSVISQGLLSIDLITMHFYCEFRREEQVDPLFKRKVLKHHVWRAGRLFGLVSHYLSSYHNADNAFPQFMLLGVLSLYGKHVPWVVIKALCKESAGFALSDSEDGVYSPSRPVTIQERLIARNFECVMEADSTDDEPCCSEKSSISASVRSGGSSVN